jgi:hypothetical protein
MIEQKGNPTNSREIVFELIPIMRLSCHICEGSYEKEFVLCEVTEGEYRGTRVCRTCIEKGDFDTRLEEKAKRLEEQVVYTRSMIGRLKVPTPYKFQQMWEKTENEIKEDYERSKREREEEEELVVF